MSTKTENTQKAVKPITPHKLKVFYMTLAAILAWSIISHFVPYDYFIGKSDREIAAEQQQAKQHAQTPMVKQ